MCRITVGIQLTLGFLMFPMFLTEAKRMYRPVNIQEHQVWNFHKITGQTIPLQEMYIMSWFRLAMKCQNQIGS